MYGGANKVSDHIYLGSRTVDLRKNLLAALKQLCLETRERGLYGSMPFISTRRIRLSDLHRWRSWQIIYNNCCGVLAWLGRGSEKTDRALLHLQQISDCGPAFEMESNPMFLSVQQRTLEWGKESMQQLIKEAGKYGLESVCANPWFIRLCVVKKIILAYSTTIYFGDNKCILRSSSQ